MLMQVTWAQNLLHAFAVTSDGESLLPITRPKLTPPHIATSANQTQRGPNPR
jgi:hypothetical protein